MVIGTRAAQCGLVVLCLALVAPAAADAKPKTKKYPTTVKFTEFNGADLVAKISSPNHGCVSKRAVAYKNFDNGQTEFTTTASGSGVVHVDITTQAPDGSALTANVKSKHFGSKRKPKLCKADAAKFSFVPGLVPVNVTLSYDLNSEMFSGAVTSSVDACRASRSIELDHDFSADTTQGTDASGNFTVESSAGGIAPGSWDALLTTKAFTSFSANGDGFTGQCDSTDSDDIFVDQDSPTLSIGVTPTAMSGVLSTDSKCQANRVVNLYAVTLGPETLWGSTTTNPGGAWAINGGGDVYRARVPSAKVVATATPGQFLYCNSVTSADYDAT